MAIQGAEAADQSNSKGSYYLAKCVLKSSVVLHAVYGHIRSSATLDVVFGKETALELVILTEDGIVESVCEQPVFGIIKDLKVLPWNEHYRGSQPQTHGKDLLVLLSDSGKLSFLTFCIELHRFLAVAHIHLSQPGNLRREFGQLLAIESRGQAVGVAAFEDRVAIFPTSLSAGSNIVEKRIIYPRDSGLPLAGGEASNVRTNLSVAWGTIWSMAFVTGSNGLKPISSKVAGSLVLAVLLHRKDAIGNELQVLVCDTKEHCIYLMARYNPSVSPAALPYHILDVPAVPGFLLILRCGDFMLLDVRNPSNPFTVSIIPLKKIMNHEQDKEQGSGNECDEEGSFNVAASALLELLTRGKEETGSKGESTVANGEKKKDMAMAFQTLACAWSWEPGSSGQPRIVFGMDTGEIFVGQIWGDLHEVNFSLSECLYKCSPCRSLLWTKGGFIAALVEMGDGQVLKIQDETIGCRSLIQSIAPILDFALVDYYSERQDQMFACCGVGPEGSLRVIRNGVSVEKLLTTPPIYQGVTGTWTMQMHRGDAYHAFLAISFVEETRVLSVGLNFIDITDPVGFQSSACTLACGLIEDGWVAQVCRHEVRVCAPTVGAHPTGQSCPFPLLSLWRPKGLNVSLGAVAYRTVVLAMSSPGLLLMLGIRETSNGLQELFEIQQCQFGAELSCISIPQEQASSIIPVPPAIVGLVGDGSKAALPSGVEIGKVCVVGTHKPSVEILSIVPGDNFSVLAIGSICFITTIGTAVAGCIPEDVRLVLFDCPYIICGLRNGMLLRFEWPSSFLMTGCILSSELPPFPGYSSISVGAEVQESSGGDSYAWKTEIYMNNETGEQATQMEENDALNPVRLQLITVRRVGISPVSLIPLQGSLRADVIALSDRPWLIQTARHSQRISYTSISLQASTHATPVSSPECSKGILFVADNSLHLVEMEHSKRLNVQRLSLGCTPRRVTYHFETKTLLVMRTEYCEEVSGYHSDICCVDPLSGALLSSYKFDYGEAPKCMHMWRVGNEQLLLVGTALTTGRAMMPSGEPESAKGRLLIFQLEPKHATSNGHAFSSGSNSTMASGSPFSESSGYFSEQLLGGDPGMGMEDSDKNDLRIAEVEGWELSLKGQLSLPGVVLAISPYLEQYILASAGNSLSCLGFLSDSPQRLRRLDTIKTRFMITCIAVHLNRIAVGDCRDGILFYSYQEDLRKLEQLYCDPVQRLVADCVLMDLDSVLVTDRHGNFCALSCANLSDSPSPERNLTPSCWYHMGEIIMRIRKGSFAYKVSTRDDLKTPGSCGSSSSIADSVVASTLLGSVVIFIKVTREEYELLAAVQTRLALYPLTAPLLGNNHAHFRARGCPAGVWKVLDGDMLGQFLELTNTQQQAVLADQPGLGLESLSSFALSSTTPLSEGTVPVEHVLRLLERVHSLLT